MSEQNKQLVRRWFEQVWNQQHESAIDEMFDPNGKAYGFPDAQSALGPEEFKSIHRIFVGAFPDIDVQIEDMVAEGDRVAVRWVVSMTHLGDHLGFPASGKTGRLDGSSFLVVRDGMIINGWNQMNLHALLSELQGAPAAEAAFSPSA
jgi:steroid delta-isomerase-like uncharacterized protein